MSRIRADKISNKDGTGAVQLQYGAEVPVGYGITGAGTINLNGNIQSANLSGGGAGITGINASNISSGTIGAARLPANLNTTGTAGGLTGTPNISVGTINASGDVSIGGTLTYEDVTNIDSVGLITARSGIKVGTGVTIEPSGQATYTGIVTASAFYGDGSTLSGITGTTVNNFANNRVLTSSGTENILDAEAELTFIPAGGGTLAIGPTYSDADAYLKIGTNNKRTELRNNSTSTYLYSYADSTFHVALAGSGNRIQFDWISGIMCTMQKNGSVSLYHNNNEKIWTTNEGVNITGIATATHLSVGPGVLAEKFHNDTGGGIQSNYSHSVLTYGMLFYGVTNAVAAWTFNIQGDGSTTFNSLMNVGETTTMTCYVASNNTAYYMTAFKIDGTTQTVKWAGGTAPSAATGSGTDVYAMTIMKTADATFAVFGNFTNFA